jgi:membrane protease YdiL (CAAX protease family)
MRNFMRQSPVVAFVVLAFALSWAIWLPLAAASHGFAVPVIRYQHYLGAGGPILAAIIITAATSGGAGVVQFVSALTRWRVGFRWYLIALFGPVVLYGISAIGLGLYNGEWPDFRQFGRSDEVPGLNIVAVWLTHTLTFGVGEEAGWRGFALPRLQTRYNALTATIVLTVIWACWHVPAFFYRPGYSGMGVGDIAGWFVSLLTGAILLTWLFNSSKGSILIVALFHGSIDVAFTSKLIDAGVMNTMGVLIAIWAVIVVLVAGPANLSHAARQQADLAKRPQSENVGDSHAT